MAEPQSSVSFAESVYALSKVIHIDKFRNDISGDLNMNQRKHLRLLDDIALWLVTESKSDVAAVSLERRSAGVRFHYAKNRPATEEDEKHIDALVELLKSPGTATERIENMLQKVMVKCRPKLLSRLRKLQVTLLQNQAAEGPYLRADRNGELHEYFEKCFDSWYDRYPTAGEFLTDFLSEIVGWEPARSTNEELFELLRMAHVTGCYMQSTPSDAAASSKQPEPIFIDPMLSQRMRLLGDYYGAAKRIVKHYDFAVEHQSTDVNITFHPVRFDFLQA